MATATMATDQHYSDENYDLEVGKTYQVWVDGALGGTILSFTSKLISIDYDRAVGDSYVQFGDSIPSSYDAASWEVNFGFENGVGLSEPAARGWECMVREVE